MHLENFGDIHAQIVEDESSSTIWAWK
jgi:hypothetical protein